MRPVGWPDEMSRPISPVPHHSLSGPSSQGKTMLIAATSLPLPSQALPYRTRHSSEPKKPYITRTGLEPVQSLVDDPRRCDAKPLPCTSLTRPILTCSLVTMHPTSRNHRIVGQPQVLPAQPWCPYAPTRPHHHHHRSVSVTILCSLHLRVELPIFRTDNDCWSLSESRHPNAGSCFAPFSCTVSRRLHATENLRPHSCKTLCVTACIQSIACRPRAICKLWLGRRPTGWPEAPSFCAVKWAV